MWSATNIVLLKTKNEFQKDFQNTLKTWEEITDKALDSNAPSLVYEEGDIIKRTLRDTYDNVTNKVIIVGIHIFFFIRTFSIFLFP